MKANAVSLDTKFQVFNVKGLSGDTRVVTLFPKATYSCPSNGECYHILAARMCIGVQLVDPSTSRKRNFALLRQNKKESKSGRKKPRVMDVDPG